MNERIKKLIADTGMTPSSFSTATNIHPTTLSHIINGRGTTEKGKKTQIPSTDVVTKILARFPDINAEWLIMGAGTMYKNRRTLIQPDLFSEPAIESQSLPTPIPTENRREKEKEIKIEKEMEMKAIEIPPKSMLMSELSLSDNIDKIVIFFKNKTYVTLKPEE